MKSLKIGDLNPRNTNSKSNWLIKTLFSTEKIWFIELVTVLIKFVKEMA